MGREGGLLYSGIPDCTGLQLDRCAGKDCSWSVQARLTPVHDTMWHRGEVAIPPSYQYPAHLSLVPCASSLRCTIVVYYVPVWIMSRLPCCRSLFSDLSAWLNL